MIFIIFYAVAISMLQMHCGSIRALHSVSAEVGDKGSLVGPRTEHDTGTMVCETFIRLLSAHLYDCKSVTVFVKHVFPLSFSLLLFRAL